MATSGQTFYDRINAARYALAGQGLARCVCKATTEEVIGPKRKHLDYLLACTHEPNVSIPQLANLLIERTNHIHWVVVFKALVTVHHLMSYGNERFIQYLASSNYSFELSTFLDKTAARDFSMSTFIRRYSRYINEKALSYRLLAFDFCKVKRGNEGVLRVMPIDRLLKTLPILQSQLDALLEFDCGANDLNNGVINACFMLLFRDLIGLFACHNDGIINLLNKYFTLNRKLCREAFDLYKKFLVRMDKVSDFLRVAEVVGIDKDEIPDLRRAPSSLIDALEQHLQNIESNKKHLLKQQSSAAKLTPSGELSSAASALAAGSLTPPSARRPSTPSGQPQPESGGQLQRDEFSVASFKDEEVRKALEEEARVLSQYGSTDAAKSAASKSSASQTSAQHDNSSPKFAVTTIPKSVDDLFGDSDSFTTNNGPEGAHSSAFDNLSSASSSSSGTAAKHRPDLESIKSTIKSATNALEQSDQSRLAPAATKKASDDLFSLLDTASQAPTVGASLAATTPTPTLLPPPKSAPKTRYSNISSLNNAATSKSNSLSSPFAPTPFDMTAASPVSIPALNGQPALKPGNPFPQDLVSGGSTVGDRLAGFETGQALSMSVSQPALAPVHPLTAVPAATVFKASGAPAVANYTNLGGLEGFGDLLTPMSVSNNRGAHSAANHGTTKSAFNSGAGLSSTGLFKGDLDSTLASLAQNLTFDGISKAKK